MLEFEKERNALYQWFDIRDRQFIECRIKVCERIQALERKSSRTPSEKSSHSRKSKSSDRSKLSSSSTKHLSLALIDAAAKSAKLHAQMKFLEKERELRRLQLEKELAIANAEECAVKRILEEEKISAGDREEIRSVMKELKSDLGHENIKRERSFSVNPYAAPFVPRSHPTPRFEPLNSKPVPQFQRNDVNTAIQELEKGKGHVSSGCRNRATCKECGRHHHTLLHIVKPNDQQPDSKSPATPQASNKKEAPSEKSPS